MIEYLIEDLLVREGGYVDILEDKGGPTKFGITVATLREWRGLPCSRECVRDMFKKEAVDIYRAKYWTDPKIDQLGMSEALQGMVFDAGVNHGVSRAVKMLQDALGLYADGVIGPKTIAKVAEYKNKWPKLAAAFMAERVEFYGAIITNDHEQAKFALGWMRRCAEFIEDIPNA